MSRQQTTTTPARTIGSDNQIRDDSLLDQLADMDEQCIIEEAQILRTKDLQSADVTTAPPAVPQRSSLRTSRLLDNLRLNSIKSATHSISTTHDVYLSSEEDASSSADDFSAEELDLEDDDQDDLLETPGSESSSRVSVAQEVTARVVSVVFVGKPSIVELSPRGKTFSSPPSSRRSSSSACDPSPSRQLPNTSSGFAPRKSSLLKTKPAFLFTDPWAENEGRQIETPPTPSTPNAVLHRFHKSFSMVRKRSQANLLGDTQPSRDSLPFIHTRNGSSMTLGNLFMPTPEEPVMDFHSTRPTTSSSKTHSRSKTQTIPITPITPLAPVSPATPPSAKRGLLASLNKRRRQSLKV